MRPFKTSLTKIFVLSFSSLALFLSVNQLTFAASHVGTLTQIEGVVELLTHPSKSAEGPSPRVSYNGQYFTAQRATIGDQVENGHVLRTRPDSRAHVVFENGDQFQVGPGSQYKIAWTGTSAETPPQVDLEHGSIRSVISNRGPRSRTQFQARSVTMGVRGTDVYMGDLSPNRPVEVSVLRGEVELEVKASPDAPKAKPIAVKSGQSAYVPVPQAPQKQKKEVAGVTKKIQAQPEVIVRATNQEELLVIQQNTVVKKSRQTPPSKEVAQRLIKLEKKAVENTLEDIKEHDPTLYSELKAKSNLSTANLNTLVVRRQFESAPQADQKRKPAWKDIPDVQGDVYNKYFDF
jgi:hypothetical protein